MTKAASVELLNLDPLGCVVGTLPFLPFPPGPALLAFSGSVSVPGSFSSVTGPLCWSPLAAESTADPSFPGGSPRWRGLCAPGKQCTKMCCEGQGEASWAVSYGDESDATWGPPLPSGTSEATELQGLFSF